MSDHEPTPRERRRARLREKYGQEFLDAIDRSVAAAPPPSPEKVARLRALFATSSTRRTKRPA